jgi:hypothetical protein
MHMPTFFPHVQLSSSVYIQRKVYEFGFQCFGMGSNFAFCSVIFDIWLFCHVDFISLQSSLRHFAKCMLFNCHVLIPKLPTPHRQGNIAKLPIPLHPMDCLNELQAVDKLQNLWDVELFLVCSNFRPKRKTALDLFSPQASPPSSLQTSLSFPSLSFCVFWT